MVCGLSCAQRSQCRAECPNDEHENLLSLGCFQGHHVSHPASFLACGAVPVLATGPRTTHHLDGPEGHEAVATVAAGPGVPARVLALFQHEHLPMEVGLLKGNPAVGDKDHKAVISKSPSAAPPASPAPLALRSGTKSRVGLVWPGLNARLYHCLLVGLLSARGTLPAVVNLSSWNSPRME